MAEVSESGIIDANADTVWTILRDFSGLKNFADDVVSSDIEDGLSADQIGAVRRLVFPDGGQLREQLVALSDHDRYLRYTMLPPEPLPMRDYSAQLRVIPITDSGRALVELSGRFSVPEANPDQVRDMVREVYKSGIKGMRAYIERI